MSWQAASGNSYRICLLDTNAISEISKRPAVYGRGFIERFPPDAYAPCFTAYSLVELRRRPDVYEKFLVFFGQYPCFLATPHNDILTAELSANGPLGSADILLRAFTPSGADESRDLRELLDHTFKLPGIDEGEARWRDDERAILDAWLRNAKNFVTQRSAPNAVDACRYVKQAALWAIAASAPEWFKRQVASGKVPDIAMMPSLQCMLYSQYYRVFDTQHKPSKQDVTDVRIMACVPYVDAVVTENFQAAILTKLSRRVQCLRSLDVARLRDIRWEADSETST